MACNTCSKPFSLLRKEKGCPGCGFSYCSKCLSNQIFLPKRNAEVKVCARCKTTINTDGAKTVEPPDAYYKRLAQLPNANNNVVNQPNKIQSVDEQIHERLSKLKADKVVPSEDEITKRLNNIRGEMPTTSDADLQSRLAKLKGTGVPTTQNQIVLTTDNRTEEEQANDLMKNYMEQTKIDTQYKDQFDNIVSDIETRLKKLKGSNIPAESRGETSNPEKELDDEESVKKIIEKIKSEISLEDEVTPSTNDELPFCEICNEDAKMRCLGCKYLFCKRCFLEHRDDDDGCDKYEPYTPPKGISN